MSFRQKLSGLGNYKIAFSTTVVILIWVSLSSSLRGVATILILTVTEVTFSFENAVINSQVLAGLSRLWRTIFLTVGIAIAVFGVRLLLPLVMVGTATGQGMGEVLDLALHQPERYTEHLHAGYPVIAAFGGVFLLMIGLQFFSERRGVLWLRQIEQPLMKFHHPWLLPILGAGVAVVLAYTVLKPGDARVAMAAALGAVAFLIIKFTTFLLTRQSRALDAADKPLAHGKLGFVQFMYLELLDASFSFDGVIAAFAITQDVLLIAAGLGIGALFVRSMTIDLLQRGTLAHYRYLVHGAHYAITALAVLLLISMAVTIPEPITGSLGLTLIIAAFISSVRYNRRHPA